MKTTNKLDARGGGKSDDFENLKRRIHSKLVDKLDLNKVGDLEGETLRKEILDRFVLTPLQKHAFRWRDISDGDAASADSEIEPPKKDTQF